MTGLILSLVLLIYLIYRGVPVLIVSPLMAMLAVLMGSEIPVLYSWTGPFMQSVVGFVAAYFPIFLVGAIFGTLMNASGAALTIAQFISQAGTAKSDPRGYSRLIFTHLRWCICFCCCICRLTYRQNHIYQQRLPSSFAAQRNLCGMFTGLCRAGFGSVY